MNSSVLDCGKRAQNQNDVNSKKIKLSDSAVEGVDIGSIIKDIHRTGAKCLSQCEIQDKKLPGTEYHVVGVVRTKPGRGDPTLSVSCSDKILRWNCVGIQGALLSLLIYPIYLSTIIIGSHENLYSEEALRRAVVERNPIIKGIVKYPVLLHTCMEFKFCKRLRGNNARPSPCGIIWCSVASK